MAFHSDKQFWCNRCGKIRKKTNPNCKRQKICLECDKRGKLRWKGLI